MREGRARGEKHPGLGTRHRRCFCPSRDGIQLARLPHADRSISSTGNWEEFRVDNEVDRFTPPTLPPFGHARWRNAVVKIDNYFFFLFLFFIVRLSETWLAFIKRIGARRNYAGMKHGFSDESRKKLARNAFEKKKGGENEKKNLDRRR